MEDAAAGDRPGASGDCRAEAENHSSSITWKEFLQVVTTRKVDVAMWITRLMTIVFTFLYVVPIFGSSVNFYYKALLANAATSALRLHQRVTVVSLTRVFVTQLILEDSCHYLFYSLIFVYCNPITLAILPVMLFAILHFANFSLALLDGLGCNNMWIARLFISMAEFQTVNILRGAAGAEIFTMLFTIIYTLLGRASLLTPFLYYRFLTLRYSSRRNHYTRTMFHEIRLYMDQLSVSTKCPTILSRLINKTVNLVSRLAPAVPTTAN